MKKLRLDVGREHERQKGRALESWRDGMCILSKEQNDKSAFEFGGTFTRESWKCFVL